MSSETFATISSLVTALVAAGASAFVLIANARAKNKQEQRSQEIAEAHSIMDRQEKQIARQEAHINSQQDLIHRLQESNGALRERFADIRGRYELVYNYAKRAYEKLRKVDNNFDESPPAEAKAIVPQDSSDALDVAVRKTEQASAILKRTRPNPPSSANDEGTA